MKFLTDEKLVIVGAAGMIGSNMLQSAIMMGLTPNICAYDPYEPALKGAVEEMHDCGFEHINLTCTSDPKEAFTGASYLVSSGGAPRKPGMTREDLLVGNSEIAKELGQNIKAYCPDLKMAIIIFNPADITGLVTLLYSGLAPEKVCTLAALDSLRLRINLARALNVHPDEVKHPRTYGGHGEQMAVFASATTVKGTPLTDLLANGTLSQEKWAEVTHAVVQGGKYIIDLRGRSSFQSPSYVSMAMMQGAMGGTPYTYPVGCYLNTPEYHHIMMAMETVVDKDGVHYTVPQGTEAENQLLRNSYHHVCELRDSLIDLKVIPAVEDWGTLNPHLA